MPQGPGKNNPLFSKTRKGISDFAPLFRNLAQTSHYEVTFGGFSEDLKSYFRLKGIEPLNFINDNFGLLCNAAVLPTSNFTSFDVRGNYTGITETFAHTRDYGRQISMDFYVDKNYKSLVTLETWMEYISSGYHDKTLSKQNDPNYFIRLQYPDSYKCNETKIYKFERDYKTTISYTFIGLFPISINPIQVSYNDSQILKVNAIFNYDRYIPGRTDSLSEKDGSSNLKDFIEKLF